jgi:hypothetical protein
VVSLLLILLPIILLLALTISRLLNFELNLADL